MSNPKVKDDIQIGQLVKIVRILGDDTHYLLGEVSEILDDVPYNDDGIEVAIKEGFSGNVVGFPNEDWPSESELKQMISKHEDTTFELKSSFDVETQHSEKKLNLPLDLTREIVAFLNSKLGGLLCIGVNNTPEIIGLDSDYDHLKKSDKKLKRLSTSDITNELLRDRLELRIRDKIRSYVYGKPRILPMDLKFYNIDGKDVCLLKILPQNNPFYVSPTNAYKDVEFRVRDGTSKQDLNIPDAITYWKETKLN